jgi:hypothetical protein
MEVWVLSPASAELETYETANPPGPQDADNNGTEMLGFTLSLGANTTEQIIVACIPGGLPSQAPDQAALDLFNPDKFASHVRPDYNQQSRPIFSVDNSEKELNLSFSLTRQQRISIDLHSMQGRKIATLVNGIFSAGRHSITRDLKELQISSGLYVVNMRSSWKRELTQFRLTWISPKP